MLMQINKLKKLIIKNKYKQKIHTLNKGAINQTFHAKIMKVKSYNIKM